MLEIGLAWPVASGYEVRPVERSDFAIYPREGATIAWRHPLEHNPSLYAEFAKLDVSGQSCLQFAEKYGLLELDFYQADIDLYKNYTSSYWRWAVDYIRFVIAFCELGVTNPAEAFRQFGKREFDLRGERKVSLSIKSSKSPPSLDMRCDTLLGAIELQAICSIIAGRKSIQCIECSGPIEIGPGARRSQSKFCSSRCKDSYHNRLKTLRRKER